MQTGKAIIAGAIILAATGAATAWAIQPRYSITNVGGEITMRLNRASGNLVGCVRLTCRALANGETVLPPPTPAQDADTPPLPPGLRLEPKAR